jgi:hypothetical protein
VFLGDFFFILSWQPWHAYKNCITYLEQEVSGHVVEGLMAELACVPVVLAVQPGVVVLAGEALVQVQTLLLLHAPVKHNNKYSLKDLLK